MNGKPGRRVLIGERVLEVTYRHASTNHRGPYTHSFVEGDELFGLPDGSLLIRSKHGRKLWGNRTVSDDE